MLRNVIRPNSYYDSVILMGLSRRLSALPGIHLAAAMMGTDANKEILAEAKLLAATGKEAGPTDLLICIDAETEEALCTALGQVDGLLIPPRSGEERHERRPRTVDAALRLAPAARIALISVPGMYAGLEAMKALRAGLHVVLFSDHVSLEMEIACKRYATARDLFCFGPECGTCIINGVPFAFANRVQRGRIGIVGASGTGIQAVSCLVAAGGEGVSQALGVGGRDLDRAVGGIMTERAVRALQSDPETAVVIVLAKAGAPEGEEKVLHLVARGRKPTVLNWLGGAIPRSRGGEHLCITRTLEEAATAAIRLLRGEALAPLSPFPDLEKAAALAEGLAARLPNSSRRILGLYSGGSLTAEAHWLLHELGEPVATALPNGTFPPKPAPREHLLIDLGDETYTGGRGHPILDYRTRTDWIRRLPDWPEAGILLLDLILGLNAHPDPASEITDALQTLPKSRRDTLVVIGSLCGTPMDPQGLTSQAERLRRAGVTLMPSNAQAVRLAYLVSAGRPGKKRLQEHAP